MKEEEATTCKGVKGNRGEDEDDINTVPMYKIQKH